MFDEMIGRIFVDNGKIYLINFLCYGLIFTGMLTCYFYQKQVAEKKREIKDKIDFRKADLEYASKTDKEIHSDHNYRNLVRSLDDTNYFQYDQLAVAFIMAVLWSFLLLANAASFLEGIVAYLING